MPGLAPALLASAFLPLPGAAAPVAAFPVSSFPEIAVSQASVPEHEWPFSVAQGTLTCVSWNGQRVVIFAEPWRTDVPQEFGNMTLPRSVIVSANPLALFASFEDRSLFAPFDSLETLVRRLGPFEAMGTELCAEPPAGKAATP